MSVSAPILPWEKIPAGVPAAPAKKATKATPVLPSIEATEGATEEERRAARRRRGRSSTILTGPSGLTSPATTERKTLLGA